MCQISALPLAFSRTIHFNMAKVKDTLYDGFVSFLKDLGCERQFRDNFYSYNRCTAFCRDIWDIMCGDEYFINRAFCWEETEQGK